MYRLLLILSACAAVIGCGDSVSDPNSLPGSFALIEGAAGELCDRILSPTYKGARDLGTDSDRIGMGLSAFMKEAEGGPYAEDAKLISEKMRMLDQLAAKRAPVDKQKAMAKELQAAIAALKAKM